VKPLLKVAVKNEKAARAEANGPKPSGANLLTY